MSDLRSDIPDSDIPDSQISPDAQVFSLGTVLSVVSAYGWYIVICAGIFLYLWKSYLEDQWKRWQQQLKERKEASEYHKNPETHLARQEAMEATRRQMQEKNDQLSMEYAAKLKEKEEQKRLEKIREWEKSELGQGHRLRSIASETNSMQTSAPVRKKDSKDDRLRPDYNPLTGSGSGTTYRPDRRNFSSGDVLRKETNFANIRIDDDQPS